MLDIIKNSRLVDYTALNLVFAVNKYEIFLKTEAEIQPVLTMGTKDDSHKFSVQTNMKYGYSLPLLLLRFGI